MSNVDINVNRRTDGRTDGRTENRTPISHPATSRCDNKIRDSNSRFILIAPCWPQRSWFSVILSLIVDFPRELRVHRGLVSQHQGKVLHQNPAMLHLHPWKLSGVKSEVDTFLNSLPSVSLNPAESLRSRSTLRGGRISRIGVCKGKLILSIPL